MTAATFTLTGELDALVGSTIDRSVYVVSSTDVTNPTDDITYQRANRASSSDGAFSLTLPANDALNLPHDAGGPQFYYTVTVGSKQWIVPAQSTGSVHDVTEFAVAVPVSPSTTDATIIDNIVAGRIAAGGSATRGAGDARWAVSSAVMPVITPEAYGAVGDGTTNDAAAFASAITAAGVGGRVFCGPKRYKLNSGISLPTWCKLEGTASNLGSGSSATTELLFTSLTGATTGITMGSEAQLENIVVRGPGYNIGAVTGIACATPRLRRVSVIGFASGVTSTAGYYDGFQEVEFLRNAVGLRLVGDYNVDLYGCRFDCTNGATYGVAINAGTVRGLNIYGGAIEAYSTGIVVAAASQVNLFGVYMESLFSGAVGIDAHSIAGLTLTAQGCTIYLDNHNIWCRTDGSTNVALRARNNYFVCATGSATVPNAYYVTPGQDVDLDGDNWFEVAKVGTQYLSVSTGTVTGARLRVGWPEGSPTGLGGSTSRPSLTDARVRIVPQVEQTLASNGAVTFDASLSSEHRCTLNANATSSTVTNAASGQEVSITFEQDSTGGRTYAYPAVCKFSGSAPSGTAASTRNTVRFRYDSSSGKLYELSRATAVPV